MPTIEDLKVMKLSDLKVMKPSDALEKVVEMMPDVRCNWPTGYWFEDETEMEAKVCPGCLLAVATGAGRSFRDLDFPPLPSMLEAIGGSTVSPINYGETISMLTADCTSGGWPRAIEMLREKGL